MTPRPIVAPPLILLPEGLRHALARRVQTCPVISVSRSVALSVLTLGVTGCLGETTLVTPPKAPATSITLTFRADSEDMPTATALGWADGIPGVAVTVTPQESTLGPPQQFQGSAAGEVKLGQLAGGKYVVDGLRWLTDSERAQLPAGDDAVGFVTRVYLNTAASAPDVAARMVSSRRHGLVISEWDSKPLYDPRTGDAYSFSEYIGLYNNADTTIHLDGLLVGDGLFYQFDSPTFPCYLSQTYALDPLGIWALWFHQLPGRGADYPLAPGETRVLVTDGIDHRRLFPLGLDLRNADFEFYAGASDVDNPDVPNAVDVGVGTQPLGHGLLWTGTGDIAWVARPFDLTTVHTETIAGRTWARIPTNALLDVAASKTTYRPPYPDCSWFVNPRFDRQPIQLLGANVWDDTLSYRRRRLPFTIGGQVVLQYTRTSAWDFGIVPLSPFAKP